MRRGESEMRGTLMDRYELAEAITQAQYAELLRDSGRPAEAEPKYRNALATFVRLDETDRAGPILVDLGTLLIEREQPSEQDYLDAEGFFLDAIEIFRRAPLQWRAELMQALRGLKVLYGPEIFDVPEEVRAIETELAQLEAEAEARKNQTIRPQPQG
jgi:hypothetical protein